MRVFYGRKATKIGDWEHIGVELAVKVVLHLEDCNRKSAHQTSHVWRDAVRLATTRLAPKHLDTAQMKECFPNVSELELQSLDLSPRDMLCLGGLRRLATLRLLRCSLQDRAALLALAPLSTLGCLEMRVVQGAGAEILDELLKCLVGLTSLQLEIWLPVAKAPKLKHLSALTGLRQLAYKQGPVQTSLPGLTHLSSLASLEDLSLDGASLSNSLMGGLSGLTRLTRLSLPAALSLSNFGLEPLRELAAVRELDLSMPLAMFDDGSITDEGMSSLAGLQHLTRMRLSGRAGITAGGLGWLATCTQLEHLDLSLCRLGTGNPGSFLWTLRRLSFLSLRGTHVAATEFGGLCELKTLRELDLATTGFSDACCQHLAALTGLTKLDLSCCPITNQGLAAIAQQARAGPGAARASHLRRLLLQQCRCSMLGVAAALSAHKGVALWPPGRDHMPRFMNVANVLLVAQAGTGRYVLRARYAPEPRRTQAMLAWATVVAFFTIYLLSLLGMMVWVVLLPLLGCLTALVLLLASLAGVSVAPAQCRHLARRLEMVLLTVLVGLHGSAPAPHGDP